MEWEYKTIERNCEFHKVITREDMELIRDEQWEIVYFKADGKRLYVLQLKKEIVVTLKDYGFSCEK